MEILLMSCLMPAVAQVVSPYQFRHFISVDELPLGAPDASSAGVAEIRIQKGEGLFRQGSHARGVYVLVKGKVKVFQEKPGGQRRILHLYSDGDLLGYRPLLTDGLHSCSAETLEPCVLQFIPKDVFMASIDESPTFAQFMLRAVSREFAAWSNFQAAFDSSPVRVRVALALLILHEKYKISGNATVVIQFSRTDLSEYVVASLETVVRSLRELKEAGIVHLRGRRMLISNLDALIALAAPSAAATTPAAWA